MKTTLYCEDALTRLRQIPDNSFDSIVTDPPYGLSFMGKKWDYDVPDVEVWEECLRVLKPGGHLLAFAGSRTYHRMACRIEDAGFEIRDQIMWLYGSGFPKSLDIAKGIDRAAGAQREVIGTRKVTSSDLGQSSGWNALDTSSGVYHYTAAATDEAKQWEGWGSALKPAHEPIVMARKPFNGTLIANVLNHGTGAINIDACRIGDEIVGWGGARGGSDDSTQSRGRNYRLGAGEPRPVQGRWPANVVHDGSEAVLAVFPNTRSGANNIKKASGVDQHGNAGAAFNNESRAAGSVMVSYGDKGSAARYFYCAKPNKAERNQGITTRKTAGECTGRADGSDGLNSPRAGAGRTNGNANFHPTVKPVALMRWLVQLVTPEGGETLDLYMGSGTTAVAAIDVGVNFTGIERERDYYDLALQRVADVKGRKSLADVKRRETVFHHPV